MLRYLLLLLMILSCTTKERLPTSDQSCSQLISLLMRGGFLEKASIDSTFLRTIESYDETILLFIRGEASPEELIRVNDEAIDLFAKHLEEARISVKQIERTITFDKQSLTFKQLELNASRSDPSGLALLGHLQNKVGAKGIIFDLVEARLGGDAGFYRGFDSILVMDIREYLRFMEVDRLPQLAYHELGHARFDLFRASGRRSIYSNDYQAGKSGGFGVKYKDYFSAEELYNFSADPYRGLDQFSNYNSSPVLFMHEYKLKMQELNEVSAVGKQGELLSQTFIRQIDDYTQSKALLGEELFLFSNNMIHIEDSMGRILRSYIDNEKKILVERYLSVKKEVDSLLRLDKVSRFYDQKLEGRSRFFWSRMANKNQGDQLRDRSLELLRLQVEILREVQEEQQVLNTVSKGVIEGSDQLKEVMNRFVIAEYYEEKNLEEVYAEIRREARIFANKAREEYKDFYVVQESLLDVDLGNY